MQPGGRCTKRRLGRVAETAAAEADALLSLPPEVLDDILTRIGIRDAVRTSALSRAWRRRWEALSSFDLYFPSHGEDGGAPEELGVVDGVLSRCHGRVQRFCADLDNTYAGRIHDWLCTLSGRGVEILDLSFSDGFPALPSSVFSFDRLTSLTLCGCSIPLLPTGFVAFSELRKLDLKKVRLQEYGEYQLEEIIDTSPLLEILRLDDVLIGGAHDRKLVIRAPNLQTFSIRSKNNDGWILKELTSLYLAFISLSDFIFHHNFANFLSGLAQVTELLVATCNLQSTVMMLEIRLCTFHNLKILTLYMRFWKQPSIMLTFCLLKSAPNLEKLRIQVFDVEEQEFEANGEFLNALWTDGMCANLQVVRMIGISWRPNEMSFIELILSKARLLHTLSISQGDELVMSNEDALYELLRYRRASAEAQVLFKDRKKWFGILRSNMKDRERNGRRVAASLPPAEWQRLPAAWWQRLPATWWWRLPAAGMEQDPKFPFALYIKLKTVIRSQTNFWALRETYALWSEFAPMRQFCRLMQYFGLEMHRAENGFSRNFLLR